MIDIHHLTKKFGSDSPIHNLDLTIKKGEFIAVVGPSGCGKSTLLHLIGGLNKVTSGIIKINSQKISELSDNEVSRYRNEEIGFIFQEFHLEPMLTVIENVLLPTKFRQANSKKSYNSSPEKLAEKLLTEVGLKDKFHQNIRTLSGGQKQRVAIARALINEPTILLADEPTGNLDDETGQKIITLLQTIHKIHGATLLIVTHDKNIAKAAQKVIQLKDINH